MRVTVHESGQHRVAGKIEHLGAGGNRSACADLAVLDDQHGVGRRRLTGVGDEQTRFDGDGLGLSGG
jgi:hypothetical protein